MSAIRLPLLYAFAGGCLSNALLFGVWRAAGTPSGPSAAQTHTQSRAAVLVPTAIVSPPVEPATDLVAPQASGQAQDAATEPGSGQPARAVTVAEAAPAGSSVSDVLMRLEEAYRARLSARAETEPASAPPAPVAELQRGKESPRGLAAEPLPPVMPIVSNVTPVVASMPAVPPPVAAAPAALSTAVLPPASAAPAAALPASEPPQLAALPAAAGPDTSHPTEIHYGDVNQNTYVTNVRQGDVYQIQLQQLVLLQYLQQLAVPSGQAAPGRHLAGAGHPRSAPFPSGITNPDNPWGFHFAPPNLVR